MLPYLNYCNKIKLYHGVPHSLHYRNGHRIVSPTSKSDEITSNTIETNGIAYFNPAAVYGRVKSAPIQRFVPDFVKNDKIILTFSGFFRQQIAEPNREKYDLIRNVKVMYFMEDDTMTVIEPTIINSGYPQGRIIRRSRILKDTARNLHYSWKDLNIGIDLNIFGITFHLTDCDRATKEFLISNGIELNEIPPLQNILEKSAPKHRPSTTSRVSKHERRRTPLHSNEGFILCFDCIRFEEKTSLAECLNYKFYYFLEDSTIAVKELKENSEGFTYCPFLLRRTKIRKNSQRHINNLISADDTESSDDNDFIAPIDLQIGQEITVLGHRFLLMNCDDRTRDYYQNILKSPQGDKVSIEKIKKAQIKVDLPEYMGLGTPEDSLASVKSLVPKEPRKDLIRRLINANKYLRFGCVLDTIKLDDKKRKFILKYSLSDGKMSIFEPSVDNSGIQGGLFLSPMLVIKPGCDRNDPDYYTCKDLFIGAILLIHSRRFEIVSADTYVFQYMKENPELFSSESIDGVRQYLLSVNALENVESTA